MNLHTNLMLRACVLTTLVLLTPVLASSQIRGSEKGSVSQTLDGTTVSVEYSRPSARGRTLFGETVPWNVVWTPGANWATTFEADGPVRLNGVPVPEGRYSMWMIPRKGQWTLTLNANPEIFHFVKPDSTADQIHIAVDPIEGPHMEMLTFSFPAVRGDAAVLAMQWGTTTVPIDILVQPTKPVQIPAEERAVYVGSYGLDIVPGIGWPTAAELRVREREGKLVGYLPFPVHPGDELEFDLVPAGLHRFSPGLYRDGTLFNIEMGVSFEFDVQGERAGAVVMRGIEGSAFATGVRSPGS